MVWYYISDSPRWHLQKGNYTKAKKILMNAIAINEMNSHRLSKIDLYAEIREPKKNRNENRAKNWLWLRLWTDRKSLLNVICIHVAWGVIETNLKGLLLNTRAFGNENVRWNVAMTGNCSLWFF